ncbi:MAG: DNA primase [Proteobacteria bacterium]|nr:DNA primase [Pseudomonadota bacterium]
MAGRIPEKFIDELLTRIDIVEVIDRRVPLKKAGKDFKACCPFHDEKTPSFTVSQAKQFFHCFGCGTHGSAVGFLMDYERLSFPEAVEALAQEAGMEVPREVRVEGARQDELAPLYALMAEADQYYQRQLREHTGAQPAIDYLKGRGLTGEIAKRYSLGFAPDSWDGVLNALGTDDARKANLEKIGLVIQKEGTDRYYDRFRGRVMFPIHDQRGRVIGFGGRVIGKGEPKYLNSPETPLFHKGREMYGLTLAREGIRRRELVLVVEGYMDVVALAQFGIDYAVATLGTATTQQHLERIYRFAPHVLFCFDGDRAGRDAAWRALEQALPVLHEGRQASFLFLPDGEDPDSLVRKEGREGFEQRIQNEALAAPEYLLKELESQTDTSRMDGRARLIELARPHIQRVPVGVLRDMMVDRLATLSGLSLERVQESLKKGEVAAVREPQPEPAAGRPAKRRVRGPVGLRPNSLERVAVALLLQQPSVAEKAGDTAFLAQMSGEGPALMSRMLMAIRELTTGAGQDVTMVRLLERMRDDGMYPHLQKLVQFDHKLKGDLAAEFEGTLARLKDAAAKSQIEAKVKSGMSMKDLEAMRDELSAKHDSGDTDTESE